MIRLRMELKGSNQSTNNAPG